MRQSNQGDPGRDSQTYGIVGIKAGDPLLVDTNAPGSGMGRHGKKFLGGRGAEGGQKDKASSHIHLERNVVRT